MIQVFEVKLKIVKDCQETVTEEIVEKWLDEHFAGSDLGAVRVESVAELASPPKGG